MTSSETNRYDTLEQIIFEQGLRIAGVHCYKDLDLMLIVLNNKKVLKRKLSGSALLSEASAQAIA